MPDGGFTFRPIRCKTNKTNKRSAEYHKKNVLVKMNTDIGFCHASLVFLVAGFLFDFCLLYTPRIGWDSATSYSLISGYYHGCSLPCHLATIRIFIISRSLLDFLLIVRSPFYFFRGRVVFSYYCCLFLLWVFAVFSVFVANCTAYRMCLIRPCAEVTLLVFVRCENVASVSSCIMGVTYRE